MRSLVDFEVRSEYSSSAMRSCRPFEGLIVYLLRATSSIGRASIRIEAAFLEILVDGRGGSDFYPNSAYRNKHSDRTGSVVEIFNDGVSDHQSADG